MILVTGGTGLLGAQLLFDLTKQGKEVVAMVRDNSNKQIVNRTFKNHPHLITKIKWKIADLLDPKSLHDILDNIEQVYHCAAYVSFDSKEAEKVLEVNINGTANLVNVCLEKGIKKFCHVSSVAALGNDLIKGEVTEESMLNNSKFNSTYAIGKLGAEREVWRAGAEGLNCFMVNPTIILGRGDWITGSSALFTKIYNGFPYYTNGINGFVDVRDVSNIMIQLMEKDCNGEKYIICAENTSYKDLFSLIAVAFNKKPPSIKPPNWINHLFWRFEYVRSKISGHPPLITRETVYSSMKKKHYSNKKIKDLLDFNFIPIDKSIKDTCNLFLEDLKESN